MRTAGDGVTDYATCARPLRAGAHRLSYCGAIKASESPKCKSISARRKWLHVGLFVVVLIIFPGRTASADLPMASPTMPPQPLVVEPPDSGYTLSIDPPLIPQAVVHVHYFVHSLWLQEGAGSFVCAMSWSSDEEINKQTCRCAVTRYNVKSGNPQWCSEVFNDYDYPGLIVDPNAGTVAYALVEAKQLVVADLASGKTIHKVSLFPCTPRTLCQGPGSTIFVGGSAAGPGGPGDQRAVVLSIDSLTGAILRSKEFPYDYCTKIAWSSARERLFAGFSGVLEPHHNVLGRCLLLNPDTLDYMGLMLDGSQGLTALLLQPNEDALYVGRENVALTLPSTIERFALAGLEAESVYKISEPLQEDLGNGRRRGNFLVHHLDCTNDGRYLLYSGSGPVRCYRAKTGEFLAKVDVLFQSESPFWQYQAANFACFSQNGEHVAVCSGGNVFIWRTVDLLRGTNGE